MNPRRAAGGGMRTSVDPDALPLGVQSEEAVSSAARRRVRSASLKAAGAGAGAQAQDCGCLCWRCACKRAAAHCWYLLVCCGFLVVSSLPRLLTLVDLGVLLVRGGGRLRAGRRCRVSRAARAVAVPG